MSIWHRRLSSALKHATSMGILAAAPCPSNCLRGLKFVVSLAGILAHVCPIMTLRRGCFS